MTITKPLHFLITGGAKGIGRGLARLLLSKGHRVFLLDNNEPELKHTHSLLAAKASSDAFSTRICNLQNPPEIKSAAEEAGTFFKGHLDCLINNAAMTGAVGLAPFSDLKLEDWQMSLSTNLTAPMLLSQACLPYLKKDSKASRTPGSIIHMSSTRAHQSEPNSEAYATTKAGLIGLTHSMAVSLAEAGTGIRVNAILPGWIHVANECQSADETGAKWEDGLSADDHRWHLSGRVGKVDDVLKAVEYLVNADFVSGTELVVDGGVTRKMVYPEE